MTYVYLIESVHDRQQHYLGLTHNLKQRLRDYNAGRSIHTRKYKPWNLVAYLGFSDE
jgi:predicted GIY-YIG superfamily endonuclease